MLTCIGGLVFAEDGKTWFSGEYRNQGGKVIKDSVLDEVIIDGITWRHVFWCGKVFWAAEDSDGNIILTWDWLEHKLDKLPGG